MSSTGVKKRKEKNVHVCTAVSFSMTSLFKTDVDSLLYLDFHDCLCLKGKFTPEGCYIVLDIIEYEIDLPQDEEYD